MPGASAYFGLTPSKYGSGETDYTGYIHQMRRQSRAGPAVRGGERVAHPGRPMELAKAVSLEVLKRRGKMRAQVAVARRLAVLMHRMWLDGTNFRWQRQRAAPAGAAA
jgi:hypothetical protein